MLDFDFNFELSLLKLIELIYTIVNEGGRRFSVVVSNL